MTTESSEERDGTRAALFVDLPDSAGLVAVRCADCGFVDFPPQRYGCRRCGAYGESLSDTVISSAGTVLSHAVVRHFASDKYDLPFTVAVVALDAGPVASVTMRDPEPTLKLGDRVAASTYSTDAGTELRYIKKETTDA